VGRQDTAQYVANDPPSNTTVRRIGKIKNGTRLNRVNQLCLRLGQLSHKITIVGESQGKYLDRRCARERRVPTHAVAASRVASTQSIGKRRDC
jgi:hypothetical protein